MKKALPVRYLVDRTGTPDPDASQYYVLDVVHDVEARVALAFLMRSYRLVGATMRADELQELLESTKPAHFAAVEARNKTLAPSRRKRRR